MECTHVDSRGPSNSMIEDNDYRRICNTCLRRFEPMPTLPPEGRPIDNPYVTPDGDVYYYISFSGEWTMVEPTDTDRWDTVLDNMDDTEGEPQSYFDSVRKGR